MNTHPTRQRDDQEVAEDLANLRTRIDELLAEIAEILESDDGDGEDVSRLEAELAVLDERIFEIESTIDSGPGPKIFGVEVVEIEWTGEPSRRREFWIVDQGGAAAAGDRSGPYATREAALRTATTIHGAHVSKYRPIGFETVEEKIVRRREDRARAERESKIFADVVGTPVVRDRGETLVMVLVAVIVMGIIMVPLSAFLVTMLRVTAELDRDTGRLALATSTASVLERIDVSDPCSEPELRAGIEERISYGPGWEFVLDVECADPVLVNLTVHDDRDGTTVLLVARDSAAVTS